jgi:aspartate racemase
MGRRKVIGVLGGMGPAATADFYRKLIRATPAKSDQDHLQVLIFSNPQVPDRTAAIRGEGPDPLPALVAGAELLVRGGAELIAIPCVTAHYFYDALQRATAVPILHLVGETVTAVLARHPRVRRVGLLATTGTLQARLFDAFFEPRGLELLRPDPEAQASLVMDAIYRVKAEGAHSVLRERIRGAADHLIRRGAELIVAGCTEVPLLLQDGDLSIPVVDATLVLAEAAVRAALAGDLSPGMSSQRCYKDP